MGYYGVFLGMQYRNDTAMMQVLDANRYDESQTITIRIPVSIPYMNDNTAFERVNGTFKHHGEHYRLVKQRYSQDTLTVVCVKDHETKRIDEALTGYLKTFTDEPSGQGEHSRITLSFIKDYLPQGFSLSTTSTGWESAIAMVGYRINLIPTFTASLIHPPERG